MENIKCIVWDFDGVLCDSKEIAVEVHNSICRTNHFDEYVITPVNTYEDVILSMKLKQTIIDKYFLLHRDGMFSKRGNMKLFSDVVDYIKQNNMMSVILTATYEKLVIDVLNANGLDTKLFSGIIGRETPGTKESKIYDLLARYNLRNNEVLYIGDSPSDVQFCENVGIPIIVVTYGYFSKKYFDNFSIKSMVSNPKSLVNYLRLHI